MPSRSRSGAPVGCRGSGRPVVEQEDRLDLRAGGTQQAQPAFFHGGVCPLVWQHDPGLVRLRAQRGDDPLPGAGDAVGADVVLRERPDGRLFVANERAVVQPAAEEPSRVLGGVVERQVHDVVRVSGEQLVTLRRRDDVVGRCDDVEADGCA